MSTHGFVYALSNSAMPGLYKIGSTTRSPYARAKELSSVTGVPSPFSVAVFVAVENASTAESDFHRFLVAFRHTEKREFFELTKDQLVAAFEFYSGREAIAFGCQTIESIRGNLLLLDDPGFHLWDGGDRLERPAASDGKLRKGFQS